MATLIDRIRRLAGRLLFALSIWRWSPAVALERWRYRHEPTEPYLAIGWRTAWSIAKPADEERD